MFVYELRMDGANENARAKHLLRLPSRSRMTFLASYPPTCRLMVLMVLWVLVSRIISILLFVSKTLSSPVTFHSSHLESSTRRHGSNLGFIQTIFSRAGTVSVSVHNLSPMPETRTVPFTVQSPSRQETNLVQLQRMHTFVLS
jgi:hypothetical protein